MAREYDYNEEQKLKDFAKETVAIADEYAQSRYDFAVAKLKMDSRLAEAYKAHREDPKSGVKESLAIEKAYLQLTVNNPEAQTDFEIMIKEEQSYKGLKAVLNAREGARSLDQSLLKNKQFVHGGNSTG